MNLVAEWRSLIRSEFADYGLGIFQKDLLAGLTVAAVALPLALAFGVASGADAAAGLVTAIIAGIVVGALGGAPYLISGPTGAMSAVLIVIATRYGLQGVWMASLLAGIMLIIIGVLRLGRIVTLIPAPVVSGFISGIAVIIALGQVDNALGIKTPAAESVIEKISYYFEHGVSPNFYAVALTLFVIGSMLLWQRLPLAKQIPASLVGIIAAAALALLTGWDVPIIGNIPRSILLDNRMTLSKIQWSEFGTMLVPAISITALAAIESLLVGAVGGNLTGVRLNSRVELVAQGFVNLLLPFFGGVPGCAAIARTSVNIKSGGVTRLVPILHGLFLLLTALIFAPWIGQIPLAALAGVLLVTAWRMNEWHALNVYFGKRIKHAMAVFLITLLATVLLDLTQAILIGCALSVLIFLFQISDLQIEKSPPLSANPGDATHTYTLSGPLFFAAGRKLADQIDAQAAPAARVVLSLRGVPLIDATGVALLREILARQQKNHRELVLREVQPRVLLFLERSGFLEEIGQENVFSGIRLDCEPIESH